MSIIDEMRKTAHHVPVTSPELIEKWINEWADRLAASGALARVLDTAYETEAGGHTPWRDQSPCHQDRRCAQARAAFAHIGTRQGECQQCAKLKVRLEDSQRMEGKRLEIMHRYEQDMKKAHAVLSAALEGEW